MRVSSDKNNDKTFNQVNTMKTNLIKHSVAGLAVAALLATASVQAASDSVTISGTVNAITSISMGADYTTLNIAGGANDVTVATAIEICNDLDGYKVALKSDNAAAGAAGEKDHAVLKGAVGTSNTIEYTIKYDDVGVVLVNSTGETSTIAPALTGTTTVEAGVQHTIKVSFTGVWKPADTYSDLITLTISAL